MNSIKRKKHKRKVNHLILFTSDAADGKVHQLRLSPAVSRILILFACVVVGVLIGFLVYGGNLYQHYLDRLHQQEEQIAALDEEKNQILEENEALSEKVAILSDTVNQKVQAEQEEKAISEEMSLPTEFPLTGSAQVEETTLGQAMAQAGNAGQNDTQQTETEQLTEGETAADTDNAPLCIFSSSDGTMAVAAGTGTVSQVTEDPVFGYRVVIDHGNGYQSIYLNQGEPKVKEGDSVSRGATLFVLSADNATLGYQIMKDDIYVNPMDMIAIRG